MQARFFQHNRNQLGQALHGGLVVVANYSRIQRSNDTAFAFESEANFWYLCGVNEPDWQLVIDASEHRSWLIMPEVKDVHQLFDGSLDPALAKATSGVDEVLDHAKGSDLLQRLAKKHSVVHTITQPSYATGFNFHTNPAQHALWQSLDRLFGSVIACNKEVAKLRSIKQPEEIAAIEKAVKLTIAAFAHVKEQLPSYSHEYEVEAAFSHYFRAHGATGHAYHPIVAGGANACTLHYTANNAKLHPKASLLLDVGARVNGYAADISRTYVKGQPNKRLIELHAVLEQAHQDIIATIKPGKAVDEYQNDVDKIMLRSLEQVGLIKPGDKDAMRQYFPHAISHGLGIDVHDSLGQPRYFEPGMVLTVEPGIYVPKEKLGLRIEDDIVVTATGVRNLSQRLSTAL